MPTFDPLVAAVTVDATIDAVTYIVTAFSRNGATAVGADFTESDGSYRGQRKVSGPEEASMTIERTNAAQAIPPQFEVFTYDSVQWVIMTIAESTSSTGPATLTLALRALSADEIAALAP